MIFFFFFLTVGLHFNIFLFFRKCTMKYQRMFYISKQNAGYSATNCSLPNSRVSMGRLRQLPSSCAARSQNCLIHVTVTDFGRITVFYKIIIAEEKSFKKKKSTQNRSTKLNQCRPDESLLPRYV